MPELPDVVVYVESLEQRLIGRRLERIQLASPFVLRSVTPPIAQVEGKRVQSIRRIGKRIAIALEGELHLVLHLMIAGRLHWFARTDKLKSYGRTLLVRFVFEHGTLFFTEAGTKKRASLHLAQGTGGLRAMERGGLEVLQATLQDFTARITAENHTLKRALTDPKAFSGIGNAYSDEILHRARLSPIAHTKKLSPSEIERLFTATKTVLAEWVVRLRAQAGDGFPKKVTAFRPEMEVHGKFGQACPVCGTAVQRIVYAENETNYCPRCQTGGVVLADRALSRLLKQSWPRSIDEWE